MTSQRDLVLASLLAGHPDVYCLRLGRLESPGVEPGLQAPPSAVLPSMFPRGVPSHPAGQRIPGHRRGETLHLQPLRSGLEQPYPPDRYDTTGFAGDCLI